MRIAHILSSTAAIPSEIHHGRYEWAIRLARAQAKQGHAVTIYAAPNSGEGIPEIAWKSAPFVFGNKMIDNFAAIKTAFSGEHDIYHSHLNFTHYLIADMTAKPVIYTGHWFPDERVAAAVKFNTRGQVLAVPVTNLMAAEYERLEIPSTKTIYHGIPTEQFKPTAAEKNDRLLFVSRISPRKGVHLAVKYAKATGAKLDIIGKITREDRTYWDEILSDIDGEQIRYLGQRTYDEVPKLMAQAKALLFPVQEPEAFGQVTVEAQACGTPVIISNVGASSELVRSGKTGFVASTEQEFIDAIKSIDTIDPSACRTHAKRFDASKMLEGYNALYKDLVG